MIYIIIYVEFVIFVNLGRYMLIIAMLASIGHVKALQLSPCLLVIIVKLYSRQRVFNCRIILSNNNCRKREFIIQVRNYKYKYKLQS